MKKRIVTPYEIKSATASPEVTVSPSFEIKATGNGDSGEFEGYGAIFGNVDWHGDVFIPGAFKVGLEERKAAGRPVSMHLNHGAPELGGRRAIGRWIEISEDSKGLQVKGKISGMNTDIGRHIYEGIRDGSMPGLSVGYAVRQGGAEYGTKAVANARRALKAVNLHEVSVVDDPSNAQALVLHVKSVGGFVDRDRARTSIAALAALHQLSLTGGNAPTAAQRQEFMGHLRELSEIAVGEPLPEIGTKTVPATIREFETMLREQLGYSNSQARLIAETGFPKTPHRDDAGGQANPPEAKSGLLAEIANFEFK